MTRGKRPRDESDGNHIGLGETLSRLNGTAESADAQPNTTNGAQNDDTSTSGWQQAESRHNKRRKKLPRKESGNYPVISHSSHARLQSFVKISDLQNLVLYLIADGNSPQWVAVRHHNAVRKVVVLMVPGLEAAMFNGEIPLSQSENTQKDVVNEHVKVPQNASAIENSGAPDTESVSASQSHGDTEPPDTPYHTVNSKSHMSPDDYYPIKLAHDRLPEALRPLAEIFDHIWPIRTPGEDKYAKMHSPLAAMLTTPLVKTKEEKRAKGPQPPRGAKSWQNKRTPITEFLATTAELAEEGYVLHPAHYNGRSSAVAETSRDVDRTTTDHGWLSTPNIPSLDAGNVPDEEIEKGSILAGRKVLAMDCEMCITSPPGVTPPVLSLTRVSLVDWDGNTVLDELVKPAEPITDYLTAYSGITPTMLENVTTTRSDVQQKVLSLLTPHTILIGHSLNSDLNALQITHPFIIDTALLFPHPRGRPLKSSLKWLTQKYLSRVIQKGHGSTGHNSVEDAKACLDLVKQKCEKGKAWGTPDASAESIFKRLGRSNRPKRDKVNPIGDNEPRIGAVVDWGDPARGYGSQAGVTIGCDSDADVVAGVKRALHGDQDEKDGVPRGGSDFVWARLRELEAYRGWWNRSKLGNKDALRSSTTESSAEAPLAAIVQQTVAHIAEIYEALPPCTAYIVYSGSGDPRELSDMQALQQTFKEEYRTKKWDELSVRWTDREEQRLRKAGDKARKGIGFITVK